MNLKTIQITMLIVILTITQAYSTNDFCRINNSDTLPENMQKVSKDTISDENTFSNLEAELEAMDKKSKDNDTTRIRIGKMKISVVEDGNDIIINKEDGWDNDDWDDDWTSEDDDDWTFHKKSDKSKFNPHWACISVGLNNYLAPDYETTLPAEWSLLEVNTNNSFEVNLNFAQVGLNIIKQHVGLVTGVGIKWNNYKFRNPNTMLSSDSTYLKVYENTDGNGKMSKLTTWYLTIPALIEFQIPTHGNSFYLSAGVEGGLKLSAHTKTKTDDKSKEKDKSDFFTTSLDYRLAARIGYGDFGVYGAYSMMPLFEKNKGPELYPISVGITLNF